MVAKCAESVGNEPFTTDSCKNDSYWVVCVIFIWVDYWKVPRSWKYREKENWQRDEMWKLRVLVICFKMMCNRKILTCGLNIKICTIMLQYNDNGLAAISRWQKSIYMNCSRLCIEYLKNYYLTEWKISIKQAMGDEWTHAA